MKAFDVVILTESRYLNPESQDSYVLNILKEDRLLEQALEKKGLKVTRKDWADPGFDWNSTRCAIFRTTWDYFDRFDEFKTWLDRTESQTQFINPVSQIRWNMDKWYLKDLEDKGVRVVETMYIQKGYEHPLHKILEASAWNDAILKPTVAGAGRHTYRINPGNVVEYEEVFSALIAEEDMMLQPFQAKIMEKGEVSFMVIGGKLTHSILKKAKAGDFRVQDDFGGTVHSYEASQEEIEFAEEVTRACEPLPLYCRVDVMWDNEDQLAVSEVELVEPELWFRENLEAADLLAEEVRRELELQQ